MRMRVTVLMSMVGVMAATTAIAQAQPVLTGQAAFTDWNQQHPGVRHKITVAGSAAALRDESSNNQPHVVPQPANAWPVAPAGSRSRCMRAATRADAAGGQREHMTRSRDVYEPRLIRTAPNGDLFLSDSGAGESDRAAGAWARTARRRRLRPSRAGLDHPFGIAFYPADNPRYVYVANTTNVHAVSL